MEIGYRHNGEKDFQEVAEKRLIDSALSSWIRTELENL